MVIVPERDALVSVADTAVSTPLSETENGNTPFTAVPRVMLPLVMVSTPVSRLKVVYPWESCRVPVVIRTAEIDPAPIKSALNTPSIVQALEYVTP